MNYELRIKKLENTGYTIIETMIAVSLFIIIVMIAMGALLNANLLSQKSKDMRSIMDNLSFMMEDMSRNLRTGYHYRCYDNSFPWNQSLAQTTDLNDPRSCANGGTLVFEGAYGHTPTSATPDPNATDQWVYKIESADGGLTFNIFKSVDGGASWGRLNPTEVIIDSVSGFSVLGAESPFAATPDYQQPLVTIKLVGKIMYKNVESPFSLQTSVSQRNIDI